MVQTRRVHVLVGMITSKFIVGLCLAIGTIGLFYSDGVYGLCSHSNNIQQSYHLEFKRQLAIPVSTRLYSNKENTLINITVKQSQSTTKRTWSPTKSIAKSVDKFLEKSWKSGVEVFGEKRRTLRQSKNPWWLSEKEQNNPRVLPPYRPWWIEKNFLITDEKAWTVSALQMEARRRGIQSKGKKKELIDRINGSYYQYRLTDDNFITPTYTNMSNIT